MSDLILSLVLGSLLKIAKSGGYSAVYRAASVPEKQVRRVWADRSSPEYLNAMEKRDEMARGTAAFVMALLPED